MITATGSYGLLVSCMRSDSRVSSNWKSCDLIIQHSGCAMDHVTDVYVYGSPPSN